MNGKGLRARHKFVLGTVSNEETEKMQNAGPSFGDSNSNNLW